jgi:hypothetical protein
MVSVQRAVVPCTMPLDLTRVQALVWSEFSMPTYMMLMSICGHLWGFEF